MSTKQTLRMLALLALILALGAGALALAATDQLDQSQLSNNDQDAPAIYSLNSLAQTFTAGISGGLDRVSLNLAKFGNVTDDLTVSIYPTSGGRPVTSGSPLATATIHAASVPQSDGGSYAATMVDASFASPAPIVAGTQYAIVATSPIAAATDSEGAQLNYYGWTVYVPALGLGDQYPAGDAFADTYYSSTASSGWVDQNEDQTFATYVLPPADTTPPTTTATLGGTQGTNGWYTSAVQVTLSATDNPGGAGVASTTYALDGGGAQSYAAPFTVSGDGAHTLTFASKDLAGNQETARSVTIKIDTTAPTGVTATADRAPDSNGWYNHPVTITFAGSDATSGIASCTSATYSGPDSAAAAVTGACTDNAGNTSGPVAFVVKYDATKPTLTPSVSPNPVPLNGSATASANASDATSGIASQSCAAVDTSSVGTKTVTCTATDNAGNASSATASFAVTYRLCLLYDPTKAVKAGGTIPLKLQLCDASGTNVSSAALTLHTVGLTQVDATTSAATIPPDTATPDSDFRYDATLAGYIYNLKTKGLAQGTWQLTFTVSGDPSIYSIQFDVR